MFLSIKAHFYKFNLDLYFSLQLVKTKWKESRLEDREGNEEKKIKNKFKLLDLILLFFY